MTAFLRNLAMAVLTVAALGGLGACSKRDAATSSPTGGNQSSKSEMASSDDQKSLGGKSKEKEEKDKNSPSTWKRAGSATHAARVSIGDKEYLPVRGMQMNVRIEGFRARVLIDAYFENDSASRYEGNFQLRLPDGATPYFFAFGETRWEKPTQSEFTQKAYFSQGDQKGASFAPQEIMAARTSTWVAPKEARMVPKDKAAFAFTETVRRQVDPALLEWAGAGVFNARVFPITPHKVHRVVIGYDVNLLRAGNDFEYRLDLPDGGEFAPPHVIIDVSATGQPVIDPAAVAKSATVVDGNKSFMHLDDPKDKSFTFRFPKLGNPIIVGTDPLIQQTKRFAANVIADLPPTKTPPTTLDRAVFAVDTSLSSNPDRFNVFLKLLTATLNNNRTGTGAIKKFNVLFFNVETTWWRNDWVDNTPENVGALTENANSLVLEGATDIGGAISACAQPSWATAPTTDATVRWTTFLLSDGAATWGESDRNVIANTLTTAHRGPLFSYNTGLAGTDSAALAQLTRETGGAVFSVVGEDEVKSASTAHKLTPFKITSVAAPGTEDVMIAGRPRFLYPGQSLLIVGRGAPANGVIVLNVESPDTQGKPLAINVKLGAAQDSALAARAYGQVATNGLEEMGKTTAILAKSYAIHHRVSGETCSLVMLESEADYERFNIKPEHEADIVATVLASSTVDRAEIQLRESLGDPKAYMKRWLEDLKDKPGVKVQLTPELTDAVGRMPRESFLVRPKALEVKARSKDALQGDFLGQLARPMGSLEYEPVTVESDARRQKYGPSDALKALSSLVEQMPGDGILARDVGFTAMELGLPEHAFFLFRRVADARPWEPQSYKAMADVLAKMGMADLAMVYYEVSLQGKWDSRFGEFHRIAAIDYVRFLRRVDKGELKTSVPEFAKARLAAVTQEVSLSGADLVIVITWNTDSSDVDLHVKEPSGEDCYYANRKTKHGGELTMDVTQGYGPEMYVMKKGQSGTYKISAHYFTKQRNRASARTKVYAEVIEKWGTPDERVIEKTVTLAEGKDTHEILDVKR